MAATDVMVHAERTTHVSIGEKDDQGFDFVTLRIAAISAGHVTSTTVFLCSDPVKMMNTADQLVEAGRALAQIAATRKAQQPAA